MVANWVTLPPTDRELGHPSLLSIFLNRLLALMSKGEVMCSPDDGGDFEDSLNCIS